MNRRFNPIKAYNQSLWRPKIRVRCTAYFEVEPYYCNDLKMAEWMESAVCSWETYDQDYFRADEWYERCHINDGESYWASSGWNPWEIAFEYNCAKDPRQQKQYEKGVRDIIKITITDTLMKEREVFNRSNRSDMMLLEWSSEDYLTRAQLESLSSEERERYLTTVDQKTSRKEGLYLRMMVLIGKVIAKKQWGDTLKKLPNIDEIIYKWRKDMGDCFFHDFSERVFGLIVETRVRGNFEEQTKVEEEEKKQEEKIEDVIYFTKNEEDEEDEEEEEEEEVEVIRGVVEDAGDQEERESNIIAYNTRSSMYQGDISSSMQVEEDEDDTSRLTRLTCDEQLVWDKTNEDTQKEFIVHSVGYLLGNWCLTPQKRIAFHNSNSK